MNLRSKDADEDIEIDMSPMIDMVFLLLIFFIVASKIIADKPPVAVPEAKQVAIAKENETKEGDKRFMISISKKDVDARYYLPTDAENPVVFEDLAAAIVQAVDADPEIKILIRGDGEVPFKISEKVMKACAQAGAFNLIFAAREETD